MTLVATPSSLSVKASDPNVELLSCNSSSSSTLGNASCSLDRVPGFNYYKYKKEDGSSFLTTMSPRKWGESCPHTFVKVYRETKSGTVSKIYIIIISEAFSHAATSKINSHNINPVVP